MKTQIKFIAVLFLIGMLGSCQDAIDIDQKGTLTSDVTFETVSDLQYGLSGVYDAYWKFDEINFNAVFTDNVKNGANSNGQNQSLYNHVLDPTTQMVLSTVNPDKLHTVWGNRYVTINYANRVLEAYNKMSFDDPAKQAKADVIAGQLYAMRAMCHFDLFKYYAASYTDQNALAVPIMDFVPEDVGYQPTRNTVGEVYTFIKGDLDKAYDLLANASLSNIYMTQDAVQAVRARVKLYKQDYADAIALTNDLLAKHPLATPTQYIDVFKDQSNAGVIFKHTYTANAESKQEGVVSIFYFNKAALDGSPYVEMSNELFNLLNPNDVRYNVLLLSPNAQQGSVIVGTNSPDNILLINKYPGSSRGQRTNDVKLIRSAEMLLIKAEAQARQNQPSLAQATIQTLLNNRYTSNVPTVSYGDQVDALKGVLKQRRIELAYEGFRFLDIKRFREALNIGITRNPVDCASYNATNCSLSKNDYRWTLPIPQNELNANQKITQNDGY